MRRNPRFLAMLIPCMTFLLTAGVPATNTGDITISAQRETVTDEHVTFEGYYPRFTGIGNTKRQQELNLRMRERMQMAAARAKKRAATLSSGDWPKQTVESRYGYEVKCNEGGIVSLLFTQTLNPGDAIGFAGSDTKTGWTFFSDSGDFLSLPALFRNAEYGLRQVEDEIKRQLNERGLQPQLLVRNPTVDENCTFYLTNTSLVLVANENTWFPITMGTVEFVIPFERMKGNLMEKIEYFAH